MIKSKAAAVALFFLIAAVISLVFLVPSASKMQVAVEYFSQGLMLNALHYLDFGGWAADLLAALVLLTFGWFIGGYIRSKAKLYKLWGIFLITLWAGVFYFLIDYTPDLHGFKFEDLQFWGALTALCLLAYAIALSHKLAARLNDWAAKRLAIILVIGLLAALAPAAVAAKKYGLYSAVQKRLANAPNVILISIDTLRGDHLGCYGYHKKLTPYIDAFAKDSATFLNAIATSPWTLPSHVTILTGYISSAVGVYTDNDKLSSSVTTLAEILRENGYYTMSANGGAYLDPHYGLDQGFNTYGVMIRNLPTEIELINKKAAEYILQNRDKKFFLFYHTYQAHTPYYWHEGFSEADAKRCESKCFPVGGHVFCGAQPMIECHLAYEGEIRYVDYHIGRFIDFLRQEGLYDDTLIIFTSDHGELFVDDDRGIVMHGFLLYDELLKVPLIVKLPHQALGGRAIDTQVSLVDIVPTILDVLGITTRGLPGKSLLPIIRRGRGEPDEVIAEYYKRPLVYNQHVNKDKIALRRPDSKLIVNLEEKSMELYDLAIDPRERANLLENPSLDVYSRAANMFFALTAGLQKAPSVSATSPDLSGEPSPALKEQLKALGYVR